MNDASFFDNLKKERYQKELAIKNLERLLSNDGSNKENYSSGLAGNSDNIQMHGSTEDDRSDTTEIKILKKSKLKFTAEEQQLHIDDDINNFINPNEELIYYDANQQDTTSSTIQELQELKKQSLQNRALDINKSNRLLNNVSDLIEALSSSSSSYKSEKKKQQKSQFKDLPDPQLYNTSTPISSPNKDFQSPLKTLNAQNDSIPRGKRTVSFFNDVELSKNPNFSGKSSNTNDLRDILEYGKLELEIQKKQFSKEKADLELEKQRFLKEKQKLLGEKIQFEKKLIKFDSEKLKFSDRITSNNKLIETLQKKIERMNLPTDNTNPNSSHSGIVKELKTYIKTLENVSDILYKDSKSLGFEVHKLKKKNSHLRYVNSYLNYEIKHSSYSDYEQDRKFMRPAKKGRILACINSPRERLKILFIFVLAIVRIKLTVEKSLNVNKSLKNILRENFIVSIEKEIR